MRPNLIAATALVAVALVTACNVGPAAPPEPTYCDGISSEVGGCDPGLPKFAGTTCDDVAREVGREVDSRVLAIYWGPDSRDGSKAVRAAHTNSVIVSLANLHLRRLGLIKESSAGPFLDVAETQFSPDLRAHAGEILYDADDPYSYAEWREALLGMIAIIDQEEDASVAPY